MAVLTEQLLLVHVLFINAFINIERCEGNFYESFNRTGPTGISINAQSIQETAATLYREPIYVYHLKWNKGHSITPLYTIKVIN